MAKLAPETAKEVSELQETKAVETELPAKEPEKAEKNTIEIDKGFLKNLMDQMHGLTLRVEKAESEAKKNKGLVETSMQKLAARTRPVEPDPLKVQESIIVVDVPTTLDSQMLHNACPFCKKFHAGLPTIQDKTDSGKFACRRCGKHWWPWALAKSEMSGDEYPYSVALEQGDKARVEAQERIKLSRQGVPVTVIEGE